MKSDDKMLIAIRNRKDLEPTLISLRKLLASENMEHYLNLCSDRLAEGEKIDGQDTQINFADFPDILFTSEGLFDCRHILENYLPIDSLIDTWQLLRDIERDKEEINSVAAAFREMKLRELWKCYQQQDIEKYPEAGRVVRGWIAEELWSRSFFSGIYRKTREALTQLYVSWKYRGLFNIMREAAAKYNE